MRNYLPKLGQSTVNIVEQLRSDFVQGLEDFARHPIKHTTTSIRDVARDYWDAGVAVASGLGLTQFGDDLYGDYQFHVTIGGALLSTFGAFIRDSGGVRNFLSGKDNEGYSFIRNFYAGLSPMVIASDMYPKSGSLFSPVIDELGEKFFDVIALLGVYVGDSARIRTRNKKKSEPQQLNLPLEKLVN